MALFDEESFRLMQKVELTDDHVSYALPKNKGIWVVEGTQVLVAGNQSYGVFTMTVTGPAETIVSVSCKTLSEVPDLVSPNIGYTGSCKMNTFANAFYFPFPTNLITNVEAPDDPDFTPPYVYCVN